MRNSQNKYKGYRALPDGSWDGSESGKFALPRPVAAIVAPKCGARSRCGESATLLRGGFFYGFNHEKEPRECDRYYGPGKAEVERS